MPKLLSILGWCAKMKAKLAILVVALLVIVAGEIAFTHATTPNLALPDLSGSCTNKGTQFTTTLTASSLSSTMLWQVNVTWTPDQVTVVSYSLGSSFPSSAGITLSKNSTVAGYFVVGYSFYDGNSTSSSNGLTLVTLTWKTKVYHANSLLHIVTASETPLVTKLADTSFNNQPYTTTDGVYTCNLGPSK